MNAHQKNLIRIADTAVEFLGAADVWPIATSTMGNEVIVYLSKTDRVVIFDLGVDGYAVECEVVADETTIKTIEDACYRAAYDGLPGSKSAADFAHNFNTDGVPF